MKLLLLSVLTLLALIAQTPITGVFRTPDSTPLTGKLTVWLDRPTVITVDPTCGTQQMVPQQPITIKITGGTLGPLSLLNNSCLMMAPFSTKTPTAKPLIGLGSIDSVAEIVGDSPALANVEGTFSVKTGLTGTIANAPIAEGTLFTVQGQSFCLIKALSMGIDDVETGYTVGQGTIKLFFSTGKTVLADDTTYSWSYSCVVPYKISVYDSQNKLLYSSQWSVPNAGSTDVTELDAR